MLLNIDFLILLQKGVDGNKIQKRLLNKRGLFTLAWRTFKALQYSDNPPTSQDEHDMIIMEYGTRMGLAVEGGIAN